MDAIVNYIQLQITYISLAFLHFVMKYFRIILSVVKRKRQLNIISLSLSTLILFILDPNINNAYIRRNTEVKLN